jgi:hypothetical protein
MTPTLSLSCNGQTNLKKNLFFCCYSIYGARKTLTLTLIGHPEQQQRTSCRRRRRRCVRLQDLEKCK